MKVQFITKLASSILSISLLHLASPGQTQAANPTLLSYWDFNDDSDPAKTLDKISAFVGTLENGAAFTLKIWKDSLRTTPVFEQSNITPYYLTQKVDTLQGFTSYRLETRAKKDTFIILPAGDFFIGWQNI